MQRAERAHFEQVEACLGSLLECAAETSLAGSASFDQLRNRAHTYLSEARRTRLRLAKSITSSLESFGNASTRKHTTALAQVERCRQAQRAALRALDDAHAGGSGLRLAAESLSTRQQVAQRQVRSIVTEELDGMAQKVAKRNQKLMQMMALVSE